MTENIITPDFYVDPDGWALVKATKNRRLFRGAPKKQTKLLKRLIGDADIMLGVFQDKDDPRGFSTHLIKGGPLLSACIQHNLKSEARIDAVWCGSYEEALAMSMVLGDIAHPVVDTSRLLECSTGLGKPS